MQTHSHIACREFLPSEKRVNAPNSHFCPVVSHRTDCLIWFTLQRLSFCSAMFGQQNTHLITLHLQWYLNDTWSWTKGTLMTNLIKLQLNGVNTVTRQQRSETGQVFAIIVTGGQIWGCRSSSNDWPCVLECKDKKESLPSLPEDSCVFRVTKLVHHNFLVQKHNSWLTWTGTLMIFYILKSFLLLIFSPLEFCSRFYLVLCKKKKKILPALNTIIFFQFNFKISAQFHFI